jgi:hypothetical protein
VTTSARRYSLAVLAAVLAGIVVGCGGPTKAHVRGTVTLDGQPLADGSIEFFPVGASGQSAGTAIKNGAYELDASVGEMKVSIHGIEVVGKQKTYDTADSPTTDIVRNPVPSRYNTQSELKKTLTAGPNEINFDLTSDKKK